MAKKRLFLTGDVSQKERRRTISARLDMPSSFKERIAMRVRFARTGVILLATAAALMTIACKQAPKPEVAANQPVEKPAPPPAPSVPNIHATPPVQAKAAAAKPGPNAQKKPDTQVFGKGKASVHLKGSAHDRSFWAEQLDVDNSGNPVLVDEGWDNRDKVLYISNDRSFTCGNGQPASGSTLMAIYAKGNPRKRPVGSGWWVSELNAGDCGVPVEGLYGCRFDASGNNTDCGQATVQPEVNDVIIVPLSPSANSPQTSTPTQPPTAGGAAGQPSPSSAPSNSSGSGPGSAPNP